MKVVIEGRVLTGYHGIAKYVHQLLEAIAKISPDYVKIILLITKENRKWIPKSLPKNISIKEIEFPIYSISNILTLPRVLRSCNADLYHCTTFFTSPFVKIPQLITIHDLIHIHYSGAYSLKTRMYYRLMMPTVLKKVKHVVTVSHHVKKQIINLGFPGHRISVIYHGRPNWPFKFHNRTWSIIKKRLKVREPFILSIGNPRPHKNLNKLLQVYKRFYLKHKNVQLVLIGLNKKIRIDGVNIIPRCTEEELFYLYSKAGFFIFPSIEEGFGLPPLEAISLGCPSIAHSGSATGEIYKGAIYLIDCSNDEALLKAMLKMEENPSLRDEFRQKALLHLQKFSWRKSALMHLYIYHKILRKPPPQADFTPSLIWSP